MPRTLGPGQSAPRATAANANGPQHQTVALIFSCVCELFVLGDRWAALEPRRRKLDAQLNAAGHSTDPRYLAALARYRRWSAELDGIEGIAERVRQNLAKHLGMLSAARRRELLAHEGWVDHPDNAVVAGQMWARAKRKEGFPSGEAAFLVTHLPALRAWAEGCVVAYSRRINR